MVPSDASPSVSGRGPRIEVPAQIRQIVEQVTQEFHDDPAKLLANLTRTMNLYKRSGLSEYGFCRVLIEAQGATKRAGTIQTPITCRLLMRASMLRTSNMSCSTWRIRPPS